MKMEIEERKKTMANNQPLMAIGSDYNNSLQILFPQSKSNQNWLFRNSKFGQLTGNSIRISLFFIGLQ